MLKPVDYEVRLDTIHRGFDGERCWVHARGGALPGAGQSGGPAVVVTLQKLLLSGSDIFYGLNSMRTDDMGQTWTSPEAQEGLSRWQEAGGVEACICDFTPKWHAETGKLLGVGHVARYVGDALAPEPRSRETGYSVYDAQAGTWSHGKLLQMPQEDKFFAAGAGSVQRVDLADGTILLPIYFKGASADHMGCSAVTVVRCAFDGDTLSYIEHGDEMTVPEPRGLGEPSLAFHGGRYYLTLRNDVQGYVTVGDDGLHFARPCPWLFDDGSELGNYNTQQHWVTHGDGLFLVYTRRGADNDHVFRHRAPLFMAQVDTERLCVIRETERIIIPERGARLGNFGSTDVSEEETWVIDAEWMQPVGCEQYGSDNSVFAARIVWDEPNEDALKH